MVVFFPDEVSKVVVELKRTGPEVLAMIRLLSLLRFILEGLVIRTAAGQLANGSRLSVKDGICCAFYCEFFRLFTLGTGSGIAEIWYLIPGGCVLALAICAVILLAATCRPLSDFVLSLAEKPAARLSGKWPEKLEKGRQQVFLLQSESYFCSRKKGKQLRHLLQLTFSSARNQYTDPRKFRILPDL